MFLENLTIGFSGYKINLDWGENPYASNAGRVSAENCFDEVQ